MPLVSTFAIERKTILGEELRFVLLVKVGFFVQFLGGFSSVVSPTSEARRLVQNPAILFIPFERHACVKVEKKLPVF